MRWNQYKCVFISFNIEYVFNSFSDFFCHDVEEVFIGKKVKDSEKRKTAAEFRKKSVLKN